jgi:ABC-type phosphate transport system substrate-binding protein
MSIKFSLLILFISIATFQSSAWAVPGLLFITNDQNTVTRLTIPELKDYYYKRKRLWPDGTAVRFIDRAPGSEIRKAFLSSVLSTSSEDLDLFWIGQKLYSGDNAPLQQPSDALTMQLVSALKGAISYVSDAIPLSNLKGVKVIRVENAEF